MSACLWREYPREYGTWRDMLQRTRNPKIKNFANYGGRGIKACERWSVFANFLEDMGTRPSDKHSLDRFPDKNGNYEPGNCRWATKKQQVRNMRSNHILTLGGAAKTLAEWEELSGNTSKRISDRLISGWPVDMAIFHPKIPRGQKSPEVAG